MEKAKIDRAGFGPSFRGQCYMVALSDLGRIRTDHEYVVGSSDVYGWSGVVAKSVVDGHILQLVLD